MNLTDINKITVLSQEEAKHWEESLRRWDLTQLSDFFRDEETGQVGAMCIGPDPGSMAYFRTL